MGYILNVLLILFQIQLRFCQYSPDASKEVTDEFPPSVCVQINNKMATLPNPIPTNRPGVEPKRPPRPVNITQMCKLSPILPNNISIKWAAEFGKGCVVIVLSCWIFMINDFIFIFFFFFRWVVGIWLVMKMSSSDLLDRLRKKGTRNSEFTRKLIVDKLNDDDEVATTSLKVSVSCPLGKMRMMVFTIDGDLCLFRSIITSHFSGSLSSVKMQPFAVLRRESLPPDERAQTHLELSRV